MSQVREAIQSLQEGILLAVKKYIENAKYDKTVRGRIVAILPNNTYSVLINGETYNIKATSVYSLNEIVNVMIPQNKYSDMFILPKGVTPNMTLPANGGNADTVNYHTVESDVPADAKFTDTTYDVATHTLDGLMSKEDKIAHDDMVAKKHTHSNKGILDTITQTLIDKWNKAYDNIDKTDKHINNNNNPHNVTKSQIGLGNVENKSSATIRDEITAQNVQKALGYTPLNSVLKGEKNGIAELDANGKVPSSQLPSYVDDVIEGKLSTFPSTGESGKIYVDIDTNKTYRWSGSGYVEISASLALGETSSTAYRGDRGKIAYDHSQTTGNPHGTTKADIGLGNVENVSVNNMSPTYSDVTALSTLSSGEKLSTAFSKIKLAITTLINHLADKVSHITSSERTAWNNASTNSHTHSNKSLLDTYKQTEANLADAVSKKHTHSNKAILDNTTASFTVAEKEKLAGIASGANKYSLPVATSTTLGGIKSGGDITIDANGNVSVNDNSHLHTEINPAYLTSGYTRNPIYIDTHPENGNAIIPFINNDIAFITQKGGSVRVYYDGVLQNTDTSKMFDGSPSHWAINPTNVTTITIEIDLHKTFTWTNTMYVAFGSATWRAKKIVFDVMNSSHGETTWTNKATVTNNPLGEYFITFNHKDGTGFNKMRLIFSDWNHATIFRITQIGILNYGSEGLKETFVSRGGSSIYGNFYPHTNNMYTLGTSSNKWLNVYANEFTGKLTGNASTASKLSTSRSIALKGDMTGSVNFDGGSNVAIDTKRRGCIVGVDRNFTAGDPEYYKFASVATTSAWADLAIVFLVEYTYGSHRAHVGILKAQVRTNGDGVFESCVLKWILAPEGLNTNHFVLAHNTNTNPTTCELWMRLNASRTFCRFEVLSEGSRTKRYNYWTLHDNPAPQSQITAGLIQLVSRAPTMQGSLTGNATSADKLSTARNITLTGDVTGSATFDGSANVTLKTTISGGGGGTRIINATLTSTGWSGSSAPYSQTLTIDGVTSSSIIEVVPQSNITTAQVNAMANAMIITGTQSTNSMTLKAFGTKPTINLPITVIIR